MGRGGSPDRPARFAGSAGSAKPGALGSVIRVRLTCPAPISEGAAPIMPGPPPVPKAILNARGSTLAHDRPDDPHVRIGTPDCPDSVPPEGRNLWRELAGQAHALGVLALGDGRALELTVRAFVEYQAADAIVRSTGVLLEKEDGGFRGNPACSVRADAWRRYMAGLMQFGLTPAGRRRVAAMPPAEEDDPTQFKLKARTA